MGVEFRIASVPKGRLNERHVLRELLFPLRVQHEKLLDKTIQYIENQEEHHRKMTFQQEFVALLKKHRIAYDERYLWE